MRLKETTVHCGVDATIIEMGNEAARLGMKVVAARSRLRKCILKSFDRGFGLDSRVEKRTVGPICGGGCCLYMCS